MEHVYVEEELASHSLFHAVRAGRALLKAKRAIQRQAWLPWLAQNCPGLSSDRAHIYLQFAWRYPGLEKAETGFVTFWDAVKWLGAPTGYDMNDHFARVSEEWLTPPEIIDRVRFALDRIELDPCSNSGKPNIPAKVHYTKADDGLVQPWGGNCFMNPPYGRPILAWVEKFMMYSMAGTICEAIALVPARVDAEWFRPLSPYPACFISSWVKFPGHDQGAPFPSALVYLGLNVERFEEAFSGIGCIANIHEYEYAGPSATLPPKGLKGPFSGSAQSS